MESIWRDLVGTARAELVCPEPERLLERCRKRGIRLWGARPADGTSLRLWLWQRDLAALREETELAGGELRLLRLRGGSQNRALLRKRRALLLSLLLAAFLLAASSLFVWEVRVLGCRQLSQGQVLRALAECGVEPGAFRLDLSPELIRSRMLTELPQLQWMTVNISGSRATVLVREREEKPPMGGGGAAELRAKRSGIVRSVTVLRGRSLVEPGDAVLEGELLVSSESLSLNQAEQQLRAMGEVRAETWRELTAVCPLEMLQQRQRGASRSRFSLQIGKKRFSLEPFPGKTLDECDTIVHEYNVGAEGLFSLPLRLQRRESSSLVPTGGELSREAEMRAALLSRLERDLDGEILETSFCAGRSRGLLIVTLRAHCVENIAATVELAEG